MSFSKLFGITASLAFAQAGSANVINLEVRGNNDYTGHMYIGSEQREVNMIYDTNS